MIVTWDSVASSGISELTINRTARQMMGATRDVGVTVPGRGGSWWFTEERGNRTIEVEMTVAAPASSRHAAVVEVADWLDVRGQAKLIFDDEPDRYHLAVLAEPPLPDEWRQTGRFRVGWIADPYSYAVSTTSQSVTADGSPDSGSISVDTSAAVWPVVTLTPLDGTLTGFTLTTNGEQLTWTGSAIASGSSITINSISAVVTLGANLDTELTGVYSEVALTMEDVLGQFPTLVDGTNTWSLSWTGTATKVRVTYLYRRRYR